MFKVRLGQQQQQNGRPRAPSDGEARIVSQQRRQAEQQHRQADQQHRQAEQQHRQADQQRIITVKPQEDESEEQTPGKEWKRH